MLENSVMVKRKRAVPANYNTATFEDDFFPPLTHLTLNKAACLVDISSAQVCVIKETIC